MARPAASASRRVGSVSRALQVLELLIAHPSHELGVSEIARQLGIGKSTAHQLLATLSAHGFVDQNESSARYRLGVRAMEAGTVAATHIGLGPALTPILEGLVERVRETSSIGVMAGKAIMLLQRVEAESVLRVDLKVGTKLPLHNSGIGRVIMAAMPKPAREQLLDELGLSPAERRETEKAVRTVEKEGYSIVRNIPIDGISAIAVAIHNQNKRPIAGLVIAGPTFRFEPARCRDIALETAALISARVGAHTMG